MTTEVRSTGERSRSHHDITCVKIRKINNNSAGDCSMSLKFRTDWSRDACCITNFQGERVNGQGHSV